MIHVVTFPEGRPKPQPKPTVFELHPLPWKFGECHETKSVILDANGHKVCTVTGEWCRTHGPADALVTALNGVKMLYDKLEKE